MTPRVLRLVLSGAAIAALVPAALSAATAEPEPLADTQPLTMEGDLSDQMISKVDAYLMQKIAESPAGRAQYWHQDFSSPEAYEKSIAPNRERFRKMIGLVDSRLPIHDLEHASGVSTPMPIGRGQGFSVYAVRWPVLDGVTGEGLLLRPNDEPKARVVALPDADQTPEMLVGMAPGIPEASQFARRMAENGIEVVIPTLIDRSDTNSGNEALGKFTNQPHREWIYRQAFQMGRHVIGYEVQKVLSVIDWFSALTAVGGSKAKIGVAGYGEGGLIAFYSAACDPRIDAAFVSGYFGPREAVWSEPIYRNVFGLLREFGDAEIARLIEPRQLQIEYAPAPKVSGPPPARGDRKGAAPGKIETPSFEAVLDEFHRASPKPIEFRTISLDQTLAAAPEAFGAGPALALFAHSLGFNEIRELPVFFGKGIAQPIKPPIQLPLSHEPPHDLRRGFDPVERQRRQVKELEAHVQWLIRESDRTRDTFFLNTIPVIGEIEKSRHFTMHKMEERPADSFTSFTPPFRKSFWEDVLGKLPDPSLPPNARTRKIYDNPKWTGYDVVLDVWPGVYAWGVLLVPKDLQPGERRPVIVCQHGRNGLPKDLIEGDKEAYNNFAATLCEQGFITFSPHNLYRGEDAYRWIGRKANNLHASMFSVIVAHHQQILNWLETLPFVDPKRMAFYGLSYGGESAVRIPAVLEKYCLSICSGDFNDWTRKVASTDDPHSFMFTVEWEMPYWNMGETFSYAELTYLIFPRPFMVERGHHDGVAPDPWVAYEYAKTRYVYDQFGLGDRTAFEIFNGGHTIHGAGTYEFLHRQLHWP